MRIFNKPIKNVTDNELVAVLGGVIANDGHKEFVKYVSDMIRDEMDYMDYEEDSIDNNDLWKYEV